MRIKRINHLIDFGRCNQSVLGIDIGGNNCKIAVREGSNIRMISERMPENMVRDGEIASPETMAKFLTELREENKIREKNAALVLGSSQVFFRHVTLPPMNVSELTLNLPYEFRDFITNDPSDYVYDYAVDEMKKDEEDKLVQMELYAAAVSKPIVTSYTDMLRKAGFKLRMVTPAPMAYARLLRNAQGTPAEEEGKDYVLVDIGHGAIVVSLFHGTRYDSARTIDFGCNELDGIIADIKGIDPYTASSYKYTNFEGVLDEPECLALCDRMAMEVSKVVNFYNFSNPNREIGQLCYMGGGACIPQVVQALSDMVSVPVTSVDVLLPPEASGHKNSLVCALAVAGMLEGESM